MTPKDLREGQVLLPNGCMLFWGTDSVTGGRVYVSDEIGGGVTVWDSSIVDPTTLLAAIVEENRLQTYERHLADPTRRLTGMSAQGKL